MPNNILATTYLFEAAVAAGCKRLIFASSAQTIEGYPVDRQITPGMQVMPANLYGVSKCYGEALCAFYAAKRGLSTIAIRIGAFEFPDRHELTNARDLSAWLSLGTRCSYCSVRWKSKVCSTWSPMAFPTTASSVSISAKPRGCWVIFQWMMRFASLIARSRHKPLKPEAFLQ